MTNVVMFVDGARVFVNDVQWDGDTLIVKAGIPPRKKHTYEFSQEPIICGEVEADSVEEALEVWYAERNSMDWQFFKLPTLEDTTDAEARRYDKHPNERGYYLQGEPQ